MAEFEDCWKDDKGGQSRGCGVMQMAIFDHHFVTITRIIPVTLHPSTLTTAGLGTRAANLGVDYLSIYFVYAVFVVYCLNLFLH